MVSLLLCALLASAPVPGPQGDSRPQPPPLRFQKSFRVPVKPRPVMASAPQQPQGKAGAVVEVLGDAHPLETVRDQTLREFRDWIVANRFNGSAFALNPHPPRVSTAAWEQTHPGGFTVAPLAPLGWGY